MDTYLIVGGTSGIELETTKLPSQSNSVIIFSRENKNLDELSNVEFHSADVTKSIDELPQIEGSIDGIVYCPGTINLKSLKSLKSEEKSSIVLFSTVAVQTGMPYHASIASAKGAVEGFTRSLAAEFAPSIRVNCIAPSITKTPLAEKFLNNEAKLKHQRIVIL